MSKYFLVNFVFLTFTLSAQFTIPITNGSFEDSPYGPGETPGGWTDCGFPNQSPPDIHHNEEQFWGVDGKAQDGRQYLGLMVRNNNTWEAIGQELNEPMIAERLHFLHFYVRNSKTMYSTTDGDGSDFDFSNPAILYFWGTNDPCQQGELLTATVPLNFTEWTRIDLVFRPSTNYRYFYFEVFYKNKTEKPYNGNVLLDAVSNISVLADTARYSAVCAADELIAIYDKQTINAEKIEMIAEKFANKLIAVNYFYPAQYPYITTLLTLNAFDKKVKEKGMRQYILTENKQNIMLILKALETAGALEERELLINGVRTYMANANGTTTKEEIEAFQLLDEKYLILEELATRKAEYLLNNQAAFFVEFGYCY